MKYVNLMLIVLSCSFCVGCNSPNNHSGNKKEESLSALNQVSISNKPDLVKFRDRFTQFLQIIQMEDAEAFNQYIHPNHGLYLIEQPGAVPKYTGVTDIRSFKRAFRESSFFTIKENMTSCSLREEALPAFNCNGQAGNTAGYTKQGCFVADAAAFSKNEGHKYAGLAEKEIRTIEQVKLLVRKTVLHTESSYKFHFGFINGKWYVLFIELIVPCSA